MFAGCYIFAFLPWCDSGHAPKAPYRSLHDSLQHCWTWNELPRSFHGPFTSIPPRAFTYSLFLSPCFTFHCHLLFFHYFPSFILYSILFLPLCCPFFQGSRGAGGQSYLVLLIHSLLSASLRSLIFSTTFRSSHFFLTSSSFQKAKEEWKWESGISGKSATEQSHKVYFKSGLNVLGEMSSDCKE